MARADAVVVGAGVIGCAVALELAQDRNVVVIDPLFDLSASMAAGAMLGALGEVTPADTVAERDARLLATDRYSAWLERLAHWYDDPPRMNRGTTIVASSGEPSDKRNLDEIERIAQAAGRPVASCSPDALRESPAPDRPFLAALHLPQEGWIDSPHLVQALRTSLQRHERIELVVDRADSLLGDRSSVTGVATAGGDRVQAGSVVTCVGASTAPLLETVGAEAAIPAVYESKGTAVLLQPSEELDGAIRTPNRAFACGLHLLPRPDGCAYLGATNRVSLYSGATGRAAAGEVHLLLEAALHQLDTRLEHADVLGLLYGTRPLSADRLPLVGVTDVPGLAVATGTYRNGVLLAPVVASTVRREIDHGAPAQDNPFACPGRAERLRARVQDQGTVLREAARELIASLMEPGGRLPYDRLSLIGDLLSSVLPSVLHAKDSNGTLTRELLSSLPLEEVVPELAILLARQDEPIHDVASTNAES